MISLTFFNFSSEKEMLKAQKEGLSLRPTNLRLDLSPQTDAVLEKALSYKSSERYPKARDFGDAIHNALTTAAVWEIPASDENTANENLLSNEKEFSKSEPEIEAPIVEKVTEEKPEIVRGKILPLENKEVFEKADEPEVTAKSEDIVEEEKVKNEEASENLTLEEFSTAPLQVSISFSIICVAWLMFNPRR